MGAHGFWRSAPRICYSAIDATALLRKSQTRAVWLPGLFRVQKAFGVALPQPNCCAIIYSPICPSTVINQRDGGVSSRGAAWKFPCLSTRISKAKFNLLPQKFINNLQIFPAVNRFIVASQIFNEPLCAFLRSKVASCRLTLTLTRVPLHILRTLARRLPLRFRLLSVRGMAHIMRIFTAESFLFYPCRRRRREKAPPHCCCKNSLGMKRI